MPAGFLDIQITVDPAIRKIEDIAKRIDMAMRTALDRTAKLYKGEIKFNVSGPIVNIRTGNLLRSVYKSLSRFPGGWQAIVGAKVPYSIYVDQGTARIVPREFMRRSFTKVERQINGIFQEEFKKAFK